LILAALFALTLRAFVPAGWMPVADQASGLRLVPCRSWSPEPAQTADPHRHHPAPGQHGRGHEDREKPDLPCAFAALSLSAAGSSPAPDLQAPAPLARPAAPPAPAHAEHPGLAAPPPPPTGPPFA
jgi:hypothetical protein